MSSLSFAAARDSASLFASTDCLLVISVTQRLGRNQHANSVGGSAVARSQISLPFIFVAHVDSVQVPALKIVATQQTLLRLDVDS